LVSQVAPLVHNTVHETSFAEKSALQVQFLPPQHAETLCNPVGKQLAMEITSGIIIRFFRIPGLENSDGFHTALLRS
jgi:hypothetical protein